MSTVEDLKKKEQSLKSQLAAVRQSLYAAQLEESGLKPKETVLVSKGIEYLFSHAEFQWAYKQNGFKPWVFGWKKLKSGKWGEHATRLYDYWERA